jgi:Rrf2 family transcriptional regulator, iron-sulfur cluster assembly transcription factor
MIWYGKLGQYAVSAASYLAQHYADERYISAEEIAQSRHLSRALVAKILTSLATKKIVKGIRGPNGGYQLARSPKLISLFDLVEVFQDPSQEHLCPFGPGWCGVGEKCPLHDMIFAERDKSIAKMKKTRLSVFQKK